MADKKTASVKKIAQQIAEKKRRGLMVWQNKGADGDDYGEIYGQGDPADFLQFSLLVVEHLAAAWGTTPEKAANGLAALFKDKDFKPTYFQSGFTIITEN